ncbi:MAG: PT domain-containing protein [Clostridia bacterium]|nr:PT domain-containing protein [Clostridia bacterium]
MKNSKLTAMILALLTAALMLAGCTDRNVPANKPAQPTAEISAAPVEKITTQPTSEPTAEPTAVPTAEPTAVPTAEPTEAPFPYNREEYDALLAFFELKDENGVKNGEKCFMDYDSSKVKFWGDEDADSADSSCVIWDGNGHLEELWFVTGDPENLMKLVGDFKMDGFKELFRFQSMFVIFESMSITNCPKLCDLGCFEATGDISASGCSPISFMNFASYGNCRFEGQDCIGHSMHVELTAEGSGKVELLCTRPEDYHPVYIIATPDEGHKFLGWYDADGKLFSTESRVEISDENIHGCEGEFIYTARFE